MPLKIYLIYFLFTFLILSFCKKTFAQTSIDSIPVLSQQLNEIEVAAYGQTRAITETPAAINIVGAKELERYGSNILSAINATPGVRMEERSPGSFRLSIRGSSLRSPFGVRNVKIYYNGIPVTDPGGFSYFNQFSFNNFNELQILKGPGSSVYGAGNGGVMLINSVPAIFETGVIAGVTFGNYNLNRTFVELRKGDSNSKHILRYEHLNSNGYREHAAVRKEMLSYDGEFKVNQKTDVGIHALFNDLNYATPGALTKREYDSSASMARPKAGTSPSSLMQDARIIQNNLLLGFSVNNKFSEHWKHNTTIYGLYSKLDNPGIRNYSKAIDPHFGGRTSFNYNNQFGNNSINLNFGAESQKSFATVGTYKNNKGNLDSLQSNDEISSGNILGFLQLTWKIKRWTFESGLGASRYNVNVNRVYPKQYNLKSVHSQVSPRFSVLYHLENNAALYINIARGYSSPTTAELAPSGSSINTNLLAEYGWNYEIGTRGNLANNKITYDISAFFYQLSNAIVLRKDSAGGDSYINAGSTKQAGVEANINYLVIDKSTEIVSQLNFWVSYTGYHFRYDNFIQGADNFSGKQLPGTAKHTVAAGLDLKLLKAFTIHTTYYFSDKIFLNDANSATADPYHLLGIKCIYKTKIKKLLPELFVGADNILNQKYSLGNDINAAGGRYYNAAMPLNFYGGIVFHWLP